MSDHMRRRRLSPVGWIVFALTLSSFTPGVVMANTARELDRRMIARIRGARRGEKIVLANVILSDTETTTIELEEFSVYTPDATILVHDSDPPRRIAPPARRYFKGRVANDPTATVFFSVSTNSSEVDGLIVIGEKKFAIARGRRLPGQRIAKDRDVPILVSEIDPFAEGMERAPFKCGTENLTIPADKLPIRRKPVALSVISTAYELQIAIETDNELYAAFGPPGAATDTKVNTYIGDLVAEASVIYQRDLNTKLNLGWVSLRPTNIADPFSAGDSFTALQEFSAYWHDNYPLVPRSAAVMVSGRYLGGGLAFTGRLCDIDHYCGPGCWNGPYAVNGTSGDVELVVPNPNTMTVDGIVYGQPTDNSWMLQGFTHELGHIVGAPHTHCVALLAAEKISYGVTRNFVDECYSDSQTYGCFVGTPSVPPEKGTIMSYCYLQSRAVGMLSYPESRYLFGKVGEPSAKMLAILTDGLEQATPTGFITVGANLACAAGQTASVYDCGTGCTFSWTIDGGSIQGSTTSAAISFTPSAASVTLTATITNEMGCRITTSSANTSQCASTLAAPANLVATAATSNSVNLSWTAVAGAASYQVSRSADGIAFVAVGTPAGTTFTDSSAAPNSSYLYRVCARDAGMIAGPYGSPDLATTVIFTDEPLIAESSVAKAVHITELRTAVNAMRVLARLGAITFTETIDVLVPVKKIHIDELRANLDASRAALGLTALSYTDPSITAASTTIKAAHFNELRNGVK